MRQNPDSATEGSCDKGLANSAEQVSSNVASDEEKHNDVHQLRTISRLCSSIILICIILKT